MQLNNPAESSSPILDPDPGKEEIRWPTTTTKKKEKGGGKFEKKKKRNKIIR